MPIGESYRITGYWDGHLQTESANVECFADRAAAVGQGMIADAANAAMKYAKWKGRDEDTAHKHVATSPGAGCESQTESVTDDAVSIAGTIVSESATSEQLLGTIRAGTFIRTVAEFGDVSVGTLSKVHGHKQGYFLSQFFTMALEPMLGSDGSHSWYWIPGTQLREATGESRFLRGLRQLLVLQRQGRS